MEHSNSKQTFESGAQRDTSEGKGRPSLISPWLIERLSHHLEEGAEHYGDRNWEKGMPYCRVIDSIYRHLIAFQREQDDEDHLSAIAANVMFLIHYECEPYAVSERRRMDDRSPEKSEATLTSPEPEDTLKINRTTLDGTYICPICNDQTLERSGLCYRCKKNLQR